MPGIERQILYDLTQKWDLINKTNERTKKNQRRGNKEQTDRDHRGWERGIMGERRGTCTKDPWTRTMPGDSLWEQVIDWAGESNRGKMGTTITEQ